VGTGGFCFLFPTDDAYEKKADHSAMLRFLVNLCADLLPFARTRLTAQAACSVAAANTGLPTEALQGTMIWLFLFASEYGQQPNRKPFGNFRPLAGCQPQAG